MPSSAAESKGTYRATVPRLENGDHLSRTDFEKRYTSMPDVKKAELVQGIVFIPSPVRFNRHGRPHVILGAALLRYEEKTPGAETCIDTTVRLSKRNEPQPDLLLRITESCGGQSSIDKDDFIKGAPEFVAEIAGTSAAYDRHIKKAAYEESGVREYLIWLTEDETVEFYRLIDGAYVLVEPEGGMLKSEVFPGLWINQIALMQGNLADVIETVEEGTKSREHADFVEKLGSA